MRSVVLPPSDILGYGPISDDLDYGRLGLLWGTANAFADHPRKVRHIAGGMNALDVFGERETRAKERGAQQDGASKKVSSTHL